MTTNSKIYKVSEFVQRAMEPNYLDIISAEYSSIKDLPVYGMCKSFRKAKKKDGNLPCWDESRVVLHKTYNGSDFIDANYVNGFDTKKKFIATQEPDVNTFEQFWQMIWQENSRIIVKLNGVERESPKYIKHYYNQSNTKRFAIKLKNVKLEQYYMERILKVTNLDTKQVREIRHFKFRNWSQTEMPGMKRIIVFLVVVNKLYQKFLQSYVKSERLVKNKPSPGPIVVHSYSGAGRTISFIAADICLYNLIFTSYISVNTEIIKIREQRNGLISPEQYKFLNYVLLHFLLNMESKFGWFVNMRSHWTDKDRNILLSHIREINH